MLTTISSVLLAVTGIVLMFVILLQRGRGGGLAGAFGAMGGQSAFGTKPGDVFTRITIGIAVVWVALAAVAGYAMRYESGGRFRSDVQKPAAEVTSAPEKKGEPEKKSEEQEAPQTPAEPATKADNAGKSAPPEGAAAPSQPAPATQPAPTSTPSESAPQSPEKKPPSGDQTK
jgi:preprotein translocase subunit SecG